MNEIHCIYVEVGTNLKLFIMNFSKKPKILTCLECVDSKSYFNTYIEHSLSKFKAANFMKNRWHHHQAAADQNSVFG